MKENFSSFEHQPALPEERQGRAGRHDAEEPGHGQGLPRDRRARLQGLLRRPDGAGDRRRRQPAAAGEGRAQVRGRHDDAGRPGQLRSAHPPAGALDLPRLRHLRHAPAEQRRRRGGRSAEHPRRLRPEGDAAPERRAPVPGSQPPGLCRPQRLPGRSGIRRRAGRRHAVEAVRGPAPLADPSRPRRRVVPAGDPFLYENDQSFPLRPQQPDPCAKAPTPPT
jgi:hypothetical protein